MASRRKDKWTNRKRVRSGDLPGGYKHERFFTPPKAPSTFMTLESPQRKPIPRPSGTFPRNTKQKDKP